MVLHAPAAARVAPVRLPLAPQRLPLLVARLECVEQRQAQRRGVRAAVVLERRGGQWPHLLQMLPLVLAPAVRRLQVAQLLAQQEEEYAAAEKSLLAPVQASDDFGPEYSAEKFRYTCLSIRLCIILLSVGGY